MASKKSRPTCSKAHSHTKIFTNSKVVKVINDGEHNCQTKKPCNPKTGNKVSPSVKVSKTVNVSKVTNQKMQKTCVPGKITIADTRRLDQVEFPRTTGMRCLILTTASFCIISMVP